jgi:hypothetical protein
MGHSECGIGTLTQCRDESSIVDWQSSMDDCLYVLYPDSAQPSDPQLHGITRRIVVGFPWTGR